MMRPDRVSTYFYVNAAFRTDRVVRLSAVTPSPRTELRLALVMNGGVSLAVWMGGVAHEIALLLRASRGQLRPPPDDPDRAVYDRWAALCAAHGVVVTVDVIAGTSAGGLNGALLAAAIAREAPLPGLRELWRTSASLRPERLLRRDGIDPLGSVLDGDFFARKVAGAFADIPEPPPSRTARQHRPQVTLFVTATALGRQLRTFRDSVGAEIVVPDHRQLYRFRCTTFQAYDPDAVDGAADTEDAEGPPDAKGWRRAFTAQAHDDFHGPASTGQLALAARASAGFPVAFEPVGSVHEDVDLEPLRVRGGPDVHLMDGGVLDNAPFGPVLEEIARRPIDGPWKRVVAYVVPSGDKADPAPDEGFSPDWVDTLLAGLRLPSEANLRSGLEELTARQRAADESVETADRLLHTLLSGGADADRLTASARNLLPEYRSSQVRGSVLDALILWSTDGAAPQVDGDRLGAVAPDDDMHWVPAVGDIDWSADDWRWGTAVAERCVRLLLRAAACRTPRAGGEVVATISTDVRRLEAVRDAVESAIRRLAPASPALTPYELVLGSINSAVDAQRVPRICGRIVADAATRYRRLLPDGALDVDAIVRCCLVAEVLMHALRSRPFERPAGFEFLRLGPDVGSPVVGAVRQADELTPVPPGPWKLWGTQLGHFAAFGRPEWRMHDWRWGRLDAAAHLARAVAQAGGPDVPVGDAVHDLHTGILVAEAKAAGRGGDAEKEGGCLNEDTAALVTMTATGVLDRMRHDDAGRDSLAALGHAVLQTLRHHGRHTAVGRFGDWVSIVLAEKVTPDLDDELREKLVRMFGHRWRDRLWQTVRGPGRRHRAAAPEPRDGRAARASREVRS